MFSKSYTKPLSNINDQHQILSANKAGLKKNTELKVIVKIPIVN